MLSATAERALRAYGGADTWNSAQRIEADITLSGLLFRIKRALLPARAHIITSVREPHAVIAPIDKRGNTGTLDGFSVTLTSAQGQLVNRRDDARTTATEAHLWTAWSTLDLMYFLGYAFWTYFSVLYQLQRDDIEWRELSPGTLEAHYPQTLPVHSHTQRFVFDSDGLLVRNDYRPEFVSPRNVGWAANVVERHSTSNGVPYPSLRRVSPTRGQYGQPLSLLKMVGIRVDNWRLTA